MAELTTLFGHIKDDIESLGENATLLKSAECFCQTVDDQAKLQGTYLHYDTNNNKWIRSGKVTWRDSDVRNIENWKCACAQFVTASFYLCYPAKVSKRASSSSRNGYFDNLCQYVALGFEVGNEEIGEKLAQEYDNGGIFMFNIFETKKIDESKKAGQSTATLKRIDMIASLIELAYDLEISPLHNISESPGFKSCLIERKNSLEMVDDLWRYKIQIVYYGFISIDCD